MFERTMPGNSTISLTIMLLMLLALVASQADATIQEAVQAAAAMEQAQSREVTDASFNATIQGRINDQALIISIDAVADFGLFRLEHN